MGYGLPGKQTVNAVEGRMRAQSVRVGCRLWTLDGERTVPTTVAAVATARAREVVDVVIVTEAFAARYAACHTAATGLPARLEKVTRPSGYLQRDVPGFRVRVVSSYLADLMRQYVGGEPNSTPSSCGSPAGPKSTRCDCEPR